MTRIGVHLHDGDPLAQAQEIGADAVQFFLGDPQGWKAPTFPRDPDQLRAAFAESGVEAYVHAYYTINVASVNNRIRIPSRKLLEQQLNAAASIGAKGLIVHGGHVAAGADLQDGYDSWRKAIERIHRPLPMLIENTAGGDGAMTRGLDGLARLWDTIAGAADRDGGHIGFCLDTCHAFSSGEDLATLVDRVKAITGRIDLVHCNNSRDEFGSGRDRHAALQTGQIAAAQLVDVVQSAKATAICETPDPAADMRWLRTQLS
ncbi:MAG: deoxyribonuclease IV [Actinobacteria bacterium]|nr:deoxyribonuclease IV [Actinomycetota bacterium]MBO0834152.1 deoxyribonuclease IV [Actinomycetota bacterium]